MRRKKEIEAKIEEIKRESEPVKSEIKVPEEPKRIVIADLIEIKKRPSMAFLKMGSTKDIMFWAVQSIKATAEKYTKRGFFEKYGTLLSVVFLGLLMAFITIYTLNKFVSISNTISGATIETAKLNQHVIDYLNGIEAAKTFPKLTTEVVERPIGK